MLEHISQQRNNLRYALVTSIALIQTGGRQYAISCSTRRKKGTRFTIGQADEGAPRIDERSFEGEDEYNPELKQPVITTISEAEKVAEQLRNFATLNGHQELSLSLSKVNDLIHEIKLQKPKQQTLISNYFSS